MLEKLQKILKTSKYITMTMTDHGDHVQISLTIRPKDGKECKQPLQINADYQIADSVLLSALEDPPKPGKEKTIKQAETNTEQELF